MVSIPTHLHLHTGASVVLLDHRLSPFQLGGPFGFRAFALLTPCSRLRPRLLGSLEIALKRTRPRQRFFYVVGHYSMRLREIRQESFCNVLA